MLSISFEKNKYKAFFFLFDMDEAINSVLVSSIKLDMLKSSFSEKATKIWKNLPLGLTLLGKNRCFVKTGKRFFF